MNDNEHQVIANPLDAVAQAGAALLRAETDQNVTAAREARDVLMRAATAAMQGGIPLRDITAAESRGQSEIRQELRGDTLRKVERARRQMRDAERSYHTAVERAVRLGLSTREIAHAADVTHGTIRAITARLHGGDNGSTPTEATDRDSPMTLS